MATTVLQPILSAAEFWREIQTRQITIVPAFDGRVWSASIERVKSKKRFTKADLEIVSATGSTPLDAVRRLIVKLDGAAQERELSR
jgi:hypothetical protein